jgi:carboxylesterase
VNIQAGGEPFFYRGGDVGCLLVHGFPGTPQEMRWLGNSLHQNGHSVLGLRLFGHATQPSDLLRVQSGDWLAGLEDGYHWLRGACSRIVLIGFSLGGVLSASFASSMPVDSLVLLATPWDLPPLAHRIRPLLPMLKNVWKYRKPPEESDWFDQGAERVNLHYPVQPVHAVGEIFDLIKKLPGALAQIMLPTLLIYSRDDGSVPSEHGQRVYDTIPSIEKRLLHIEGSGHSLARDAQREQVFAAVGDFIQGGIKNLL